MDDDRATVETNISYTNPSRTDTQLQNSYLEQIGKNSKELENFLNVNIKLRSSLDDLIQAFLNNNDERLKNSYSLLKDNLKIIETNSLNLSRILQSVNMNSQSNVYKEDFNYIFADKNMEINEALIKLEFNGKYNFTISTFKELLNIKKDEILKDILKEDYFMFITKSYTKILNNFKNTPPEKVNEIPSALIEEINQKFYQSLQLSMTVKENVRNITINVLNSFVIMIKVSNEFNFSFKMNVTCIDEYHNIIPVFERKEGKFMNICRRNKVDEKSSFKVFRKIGLLMEDRFYILLKYRKYPFKMGFFLFINWISNYNDLFKKKCNLCKMTAKLNFQDKCFYPPYYKFMDMESDFFHEECYNSINGSNI